MKKPPTPEAVAMGEALTAARAAKFGDHPPSYGTIERMALEQLGRTTPDRETIRNYHNGVTPPERADLGTMRFLANLYEVPLYQLSPIVAERLEALYRLSPVEETPAKLAELTRSGVARFTDRVPVLAGV
jgi:hypothetical protein